MTINRSFRFTKAIVRRPAASVVGGLRDGAGDDPDFSKFNHQHLAYNTALKKSGVSVIELPPLEEFPDSVFVEDSALCLADAAIILRPGAASRFGEAAHVKPALEKQFSKVMELPGSGFIDGGDVLLTDTEALIGLSGRTNQAGFDALATILWEFGYKSVRVETPPSILHFKTDCGLLDSNTIFSTSALASTGCFENYHVIEVPEGEEVAANIVRFNDDVLISAGFPKSESLLSENRFHPVTINTSEAAKIDGGLSCMSLRF